MVAQTILAQARAVRQVRSKVQASNDDQGRRDASSMISVTVDLTEHKDHPEALNGIAYDSLSPSYQNALGDCLQRRWQNCSNSRLITVHGSHELKIRHLVEVGA